MELQRAEVIEISDIIGKRGKYQIALLLISFYINSLMGTVHVFVELLAPQVDVYWSRNNTVDKTMVFTSTNCRFADLYNYQDRMNDTQSEFKLVYESPYSKNSLTEELNLICDRAWLVSFANSLQMIGCFGGSILFAMIAERYGRKYVTIFLLVFAFLANICILFQRNTIVFLAACFVYGSTVIPTYQTSLAPVVEIIPTSSRALYGTLSRYGSIFGQTLLVGFSWIFKDWIYNQIAQTVFSGTCVFFSWYILESPLWLAVRGKEEEARENLMAIVRRNGISEDDVKSKVELWLQQMKVRSEAKSTSEKGMLKDLFQNRIITKYTILLSFVTISIMFVYLGLVMNVQSFGGNFYEDLTISNALALATGVVTSLLLLKFSIRNLTMASLFLLALTCLAYVFTHEYPLARTVLSILARIFVSPPYNTLYLYLSEVYPTSVRVIGTGFSSMMARLPAALSPFTKELGAVTEPYVPFLVFGAFSLLSGLALGLLPQTKGRKLPQTVEELKELQTENSNLLNRKRNRSINCWPCF